MERLTYDEFQAVFRSSRRAWHLELKDTYNVAGEDEPFRRFLAGDHDDYAWLGEWLDFVRETSRAGTRVERLRIVSVPHTDYTSWGLSIARRNVSAGEDVRYLPRDTVRDTDFPADDCWLFDDDQLVLSVFSDDGRTGGFVLAADTELAERYRAIRDELWPRAIPADQYASGT